MKNLKLVNLIMQIFKFGIVGVMATIIEWFLFYVFSNVLKIHYLIAVIFAYCFSTVFNYFLSIKLVFNVSDNNKQKFVVFAMLSVIGLVINEILMLFFVELLIMNPILAKIISTLIVMGYNFVTRKIFIEDKC